MIVEIAGEERLRLVRGQARPVHGARNAAAQHLALPHLPCLLAKEIIPRNFVEPVRQRPLALLRPGDGGVGGDARRTIVEERAAARSHKNHSFAAQ